VGTGLTGCDGPDRQRNNPLTGVYSAAALMTESNSAGASDHGPDIVLLLKRYVCCRRSSCAPFMFPY
jgi:hypothetical protein